MNHGEKMFHKRSFLSFKYYMIPKKVPEKVEKEMAIHFNIFIWKIT